MQPAVSCPALAVPAGRRAHLLTYAALLWVKPRCPAEATHKLLCFVRLGMAASRMISREGVGVGGERRWE